MDKDTFTLNNQTYSNNNNILLGIIYELQQISNSSHENLTIKRISDVIIKMNFIINENKKTRELIMNQFTLLQNQIQRLSQKIDFNSFNTNTPKYSTQITNNINNQQELIRVNGRYVGQVVNGLREGKGITYWEDGDKYEGDYRNDNKEGKGIYYFNNGDRYEGDFRNNKKEGKGIMYYNDGDRSMGDYYNDKPIGIHAYLTKNGEVKPNYY